jgi:hypothetical protein
MIRLFVVGEKLAIDKTERATTLRSWSMAWIKYHDQVAYDRWSVVGGDSRPCQGYLCPSAYSPGRSVSREPRGVSGMRRGAAALGAV